MPSVDGPPPDRAVSTDTSDIFGRLLEVVVLVGLPWLSRASLWGGAAGATWPELLAVPVWIAAALAGRRAWRGAGRGVWPAISLYAAALAAGTLVLLSERHRVGSPVLAANLGVAVRSWFGAWSTADPLYPLRSSVVYFIGPLFFLAVRAVWSRERRPRLIEGLILWAGAAAAGLGIVQVALGRGLSFETVPGEPVVGRATGPLPDPNAFASYLALVAAFGAVVWVARVRERAGDARRRTIAASVAWAALVAAGLWVSGSRAAILALGGLWGVNAAGAVYASRRRDRSRTRWMPATAAIVVTLASLVGFATLGGYGTEPDRSRVHRFLSTFDVGQSSMRLFRGRPVLWRAGATMVMDEPVTGVGAGRFGVELARRLPVELWGVTTAENAHNYYLQAAAETGLVGLAGLLLLLAAAGEPLWRKRHQLPARAALCGGAAWCLTSLVGHPQLIPSLQLFFWGFLGMTTAGFRLPRVGPGAVGLGVLLALLGGRVSQAALSPGDGPALYAAGLYQPEPSAPGDEVRRWTSTHTLLDLRREGDVVELRFFVAHEKFPVSVRVAAGPWREERRFFEPGWKTLTYYVPPDGSGRLTASLDTSPPLAVADDPRDLGVMLAPLRWRHGIPDGPLGVYASEQSVDGHHFRWTAGVACLPLDGSGDVEINLRADNPDLEADPLLVSLTRPGEGELTVSIEDRSWQPVRIPGGASAAEVMCVQTSRTWNPREDAGSADARDLGVAISFASGRPRGW